MTAADLFARAERRARGSTLGRSLLACAAGLALLGAAYCRGRAVGETSARMTEARRGIAAAEIARGAAAETVTVAAHETAIAAKRAKAADAIVRVVDPTTLAVEVTPASPAMVIRVPEPVIARIEADSALIEAQATEILGLRALIVADSVVIRSQQVALQDLEHAKAPRCGMKCGIGLGVGGLLGLVALMR